MCLDAFEGKWSKTLTGLKEMGDIGWVMAWTLRKQVFVYLL